MSRLGSQRTVRIALIDDHALVVEGLAALIAKHPDLEVCGEADNAKDAVELVGRTQPHVAIVDISLKNSSGIDLITRLKSRFSSVKVIVSSMHDELVYAERALQAGAMGYVHKQQGSEKIIDAIRCVMEDRIFVSEEVSNRLLARAAKKGIDMERSPVESLSNRELQVFELIGQGYSTRKIAERLHLSTKTIDTYRQNIKVKLNLSDAAEVNHYAAQWVLNEQHQPGQPL
jgi:DNA-binding NarL/FixJ family response regulator